MNPQIEKAIERHKDFDRMPCEMPSEQTDIQKFFAGKSVLLTGATGFMGKIFVEKILRCCPDLKTLYVVVRQKKGVPQEEKMKKYFQDFVFNWLRKSNPNFESKVVTIKGDLQEDNLGISDSDRQILISEVDIIVHSGATTKFNEKVHIALKINVLATKSMLELALQCKRIKAFIYVSTAYSHCYRKNIEERFYEAPADLKTVYDMIESDLKAEDGITEEALQMLLGKWANVYTFTKSMAEELVRQYGEKANFPCAIYRPSIVTAAHQEPFPGWIDSNGGPALVFIGVGLGMLHTIYYDDSPMDLVPVDMSINSLLAAIYDLPDRWQREKQPVVYNYGSSTVEPITLSRMFKTLKEVCYAFGSKKMLYTATFIFTESKLLFYILHILTHFFPALLADIVLLAIGQKPRCLSLFWFGTKHLGKIFYFINGNWKIHVTEMMKVHDRLSPADRKLFHFDLHGFNWEDFIIHYSSYVRTYILKDTLEDLPKTHARAKKFYQLHVVFMSLLALFVVYYGYRIFNFLLNTV